jgi:hypothetical protein
VSHFAGGNTETMENKEGSRSQRPHEKYETIISPPRPRAASSSSSTRRSGSSHHHSTRSDGGSFLECSPPVLIQKRSERQLVESRQRWTVLVAIFEVKLMLAHENSGYSQTARGGSNSDDLEKVELELVEKEVGLSGSEIRKIWSEYIAQKKTTLRNSDQISMINQQAPAEGRATGRLLRGRGASGARSGVARCESSSLKVWGRR